MSQYHVYQTEADYAFIGWERAKEKFSLGDYKSVYSGELVDSVSCNGEEKRINQNDREVLENLFEMFNLRKPEDFQGRSLSVSDVVEIVRKTGLADIIATDLAGWKLQDSHKKTQNRIRIKPISRIKEATNSE